MSKYSSELKIEIVQYMLEGNHSFGDASRKYEITKSQIQKWVRLYKNQGIEGLIPKYSSYSGDFKIRVVEYMHNHNASKFDTAAKFGIPSMTTVSKWERIYYQEGPEALYRNSRGRSRKNMNNKSKKIKISKDEEENLVEEVQRLRMENAYLKKLNALVQEREKLHKKTK